MLAFAATGAANTAPTVTSPAQPGLEHADRELLGWTPAGPGLLADLDQEHYYRG